MSLQARLQRRIQRYGWDLAADRYEPLWQSQLAVAHARMLEMACPQAGERVLDVACGSGAASFAAAERVGVHGHVLGVDLSERMVDVAALRARCTGVGNAAFQRMDGECLDCADSGFDLVLCALGLMYMPDPEQAVREMHRVLRPGGRIAIAVWGERARCGWSAVFPIVDAEVRSDVCPLFFQLGGQDTLAQLCATAGFHDTRTQRVQAMLEYADARDACDAAFIGGPVAMAWSRFDAATRERARHRYLQAIEPWRTGEGYCVPGEFVLLSATRPAP